MANLILYLLIVLVQGSGPTGLIFGDQAECETLRVDLAKRQGEVLALSACLAVPLEKMPQQKAQK